MISDTDVPQNYLRVMQTLHLGIGLAIIPMSIMIPVVAGTAPPSEGDYNTIKLLTQIHVVIFLGTILASSFVSARMMHGPTTQLHSAGAGNKDLAWSSWLESYKNTHIVSLALREGPAFLGLVTLLLASINGVLWEDPFFWVNYFSSALFVLYLVLSFPTAEKIAAAARI
jgi:hypothetical protein